MVCLGFHEVTLIEQVYSRSRSICDTTITHTLVHLQVLAAAQGKGSRDSVSSATDFEESYRYEDIKRVNMFRC